MCLDGTERDKLPVPFLQFIIGTLCDSFEEWQLNKWSKTLQFYITADTCRLHYVDPSVNVIVLMQNPSLEAAVLRRLLPEILGVSQHYENLLCSRKWRYKHIMLHGNFTVFLLHEVIDHVCKLCASVQQLCFLLACEATWNRTSGFRFPVNLMSNIHISSARGISFLVSWKWILAKSGCSY